MRRRIMTLVIALAAICGLAVSSAEAHPKVKVRTGGCGYNVTYRNNWGPNSRVNVRYSGNPGFVHYHYRW
jgi:hypothetical protein